MKMHRSWAMPTGDTFSAKPIADFVSRWTEGARVIVDPFARNSMLGTHRNDLSPDTAAEWHMDAEDFCKMLLAGGVRADVLLFDPPYSPRQMSEIYQRVGMDIGAKGTQNAALYKRVRDAAAQIIAPQGVVLSFGWNSAGMGKCRGYEQREILLVAHGGAHNDTICVAETRVTSRMPTDMEDIFG